MGAIIHLGLEPRATPGSFLENLTPSPELTPKKKNGMGSGFRVRVPIIASQKLGCTFTGRSSVRC